MRRLFVLTAVAAAVYVPVSPATAGTRCDVEYKSICVNVCGSASQVVRLVLGEDQFYCA